MSEGSESPGTDSRQGSNRTNPSAGYGDQGVIQYDPVRGLLVQVGEPPHWVEAVYHNDIRDQLLAIASNNGEYRYDQPRARGPARNDETAYLESQRHWRTETEYWYLIKDDVLNRFQRDGYPIPRYRLNPLYHERRMVIDLENHPVRDFRDLPLTFSSQLEGWLIETITRLDLRIEKADFRARMPTYVFNKQNLQIPICTISALGNRAMRFRQQNKLAAWKPRGHTDKINAQILKAKAQESAAAEPKPVNPAKTPRAPAKKPGPRAPRTKPGPKPQRPTVRLQAQGQNKNPAPRADDDADDDNDDDDGDDSDDPSSPHQLQALEDDMTDAEIWWTRRHDRLRLYEQQRYRAPYPWFIAALEGDTNDRAESEGGPGSDDMEEEEGDEEGDEEEEEEQEERDGDEEEEEEEGDGDGDGDGEEGDEEEEEDDDEQDSGSDFKPPRKRKRTKR